jgi:periplasmic protein TonB
MFRESLIETSHAGVVQRGWATLMSFGMEMALLSLLMLTPIIFTQVIPVLQKAPGPPMMTSISREDIERAIRVFSGNTNSGGDHALIAPGHISPVIDRGGPSGPQVGQGGPAGICEDCAYVPNLPISLADPNAVLSSFRMVGTKPPVLANGTVESVVKRSQMSPGMLVAKVEPRYPELAKIARVQGEVLMAARIDREGRIVNLTAVRGHHLLVPAALAAVSQWRYRPTMLNGQPVEVDTQITVNFVLNQ